MCEHVRAETPTRCPQCSCHHDYPGHRVGVCKSARRYVRLEWRGGCAQTRARSAARRLVCGALCRSVCARHRLRVWLPAKRPRDNPARCGALATCGCRSADVRGLSGRAVWLLLPNTCGVLKDAVGCSVVVVCCSVLVWLLLTYICRVCNLLQGVAGCCSALQCVAVRCSALQSVAVYCSALQSVAVRCSLLQCAGLAIAFTKVASVGVGVSVGVSVHVCVHVCVCVCTRVCKCVCVYVYVVCVCVFVYVYVYVCIRLDVCMCTCVYMGICVCM